MIIDGNAVLYRAWHALPPLATKDGRVISGAYGFTMTLLGAVREFKPTHLAVTFDLKGKTFRHEQFHDYKAQREKKPDELYAQIPLIERILAAMNVPVFTAQGFEADDVIGTINEQAKAADAAVGVLIVTGDLDTLQLVDERTRVYTMRRGITDMVVYDDAAVRARFNLRPDQMVDYKGLRGDPSDNIPGVKGIGEVTASALLSEFGSLDELYAALEQDDRRAAKIRPAAKEKLLAGKKEAFEARDLCRIRRDAPVDFKLDRAVFSLPQQAQVRDIFEEFQFARLLQQLPEGSEPAPAKTSELKDEAAKQPSAPTIEDAAARPAAISEPVTIIDDGQAVAALVAEFAHAKIIAFRSSTESADPIAPGLIGLGLTDGSHHYILTKKAVAGGKKSLQEFFADGGKKPTLVCHDLKREINVFYSLGWTIAHPCFDLMIASYLIFSGERRNSLEALLAYFRQLPAADAKDDSVEAKLARLQVELPQLLPLADELRNKLEALQLANFNETLELPLVPVLARMERTGVAIDAAYLQKLSRELGGDIAKLEKRIHKLAGEEFNINSPKQVSRILFEKLELSSAGLKKTAKNKALSTAAAELEKLRGRHEIIDALLEYREVAKMRSTYVEALPALVNAKTGRVHASFNQAVTATGRLSSSDPNLQNIPTAETDLGRRVRNAFIARPGCVLLAADYSQIELRIAAHITGAKAMTKAFLAGEDIHWRTAVEMWGEAEAASKRRIAKAINFGILYGMGPQRLAESSGVTMPEAREFIDRYFAVNPELADYIEAMKEKLSKDGYVETLFGRRRFFPNYHLLNQREKAAAERQAINMPMQGTQADLIKLAMTQIDERLRRDYGEGEEAPRLIIQVHDELIFEVPAALASKVAPVIRELMVGVRKFDVPIAVNLSAGERWGDLVRLAE